MPWEPIQQTKGLVTVNATEFEKMKLKDNQSQPTNQAFPNKATT